MIKALAGNLIILGLSDGNISRLKQGDPIHIFGVELGIEKDIVILWGETEAKIAAALKPMINDETVIRTIKKQ